MTVSAPDYDYVRRLVEDRSAIALATGKEYLVDARLAPVADRRGLGSVAELVGHLRAGTPGLHDEVVEAICTHETSFFRDVHPFEALRTEIIPALLAERVRPLVFWSAAASSGQEAYSLAMLVREHFADAPEPSILATDLSRDVLVRASSGRFSQLEVNRGLPARLLVKYFERVGTGWQIRDEVRRMVTFGQHNLSQPWPALPAVDVVFLRNVLIYFSQEAKAVVLEQMASVLRPGGVLFMGTAESTHGLSDRYEREAVGKAFCYRLIEKGA